ncbi:MAG: hypothetical protein ACSHX6_10365 [Akkermansiaceae bacterium]
MENPYQQNQPLGSGGNLFQSEQGVRGISATSIAQSHLYASRGWVRFMSVLGFIYFAIMVLGTFGMLAVVGQVGGFAIIGLLLMIVMTVVVFLLANSLSKYSGAITRTEISRNPADLETAILYQMKFWKLAGILTLIGLVMAILGLFVPSIARMF